MTKHNIQYRPFFVSALVLSLLIADGLFGAEARDPDATPATQAHPGQRVSRWDGMELLAQRKKRKRRRGKRGRRARSKKKATKAESAPEAAVTPDATVDGESANAEGALQAPNTPSAPTMGEGQSLQRSNAMEFDDRLIRGEKAGSGAVILFDRRARRLPRLTRDRRDFFQQTVRTVLGKDRPGK